MGYFNTQRFHKNYLRVLRTELPAKMLALLETHHEALLEVLPRHGFKMEEEQNHCWYTPCPEQIEEEVLLHCEIIAEAHGTFWSDAVFHAMRVLHNLEMDALSF